MVSFGIYLRRNTDSGVKKGRSAVCLGMRWIAVLAASERNSDEDIN